ncbi:MAG: hypothetical protein FWF29_07765 [Treponema sp.]|nr:hypothetical protein [Treponema sp.]
MKGSIHLLGLAFLLCIGTVSAQEADQQNSKTGTEPQKRPGFHLEDVLPGFAKQAVVLDINARVIENNMREIWNESHQRVTISGRAVGIKMVGSNVIVVAQFIPYLRHRGQNILVAQGQIWLDVPNQGIQYQTTMQTIPVDFDEPVYFFPLGSSDNGDDAKIEIMLTMRQYTAPAPDDSGNEENSAP